MDTMFKYLKHFSVFILFASFIFLISSSNVSAESCGASGQGTCKAFCDRYEEYISSVSVAGANTCDRETPSCCVPVYCGSNSAGIGRCLSLGSTCAAGQIFVSAKDCNAEITEGQEGKQGVCCVIPKTTISGQENLNVFGQPTELPTSPIYEPEGTTGGLVPCEGPNCTLCDLLILIKNIINFLLGLTFAFAGGFIVWGSIIIMTSGGSEEKVGKGREMITTAVIGVAIALLSWLFIGTILQVLTNSPSPLPWNEIQCQ